MVGKLVGSTVRCSNQLSHGGIEEPRPFTRFYITLKAIFMANSIKVLFWVHRSKINKEGKAPLILRLTYQNQKAEKATGFYVFPNQWNVSRQKLRGNKDNADEVNNWLEITNSKIFELFKNSVKAESFHLNSLLQATFAKNTEEPVLIDVIQEYVQQLKKRVGKDFAYSTYEKYVFTLDKVKAFVKHQYKQPKFLLRDLNTKFIIDFDHYLRVVDNNQHNTAVKYCLNLKREINICVLKGLLTSNPLNAYKTVYKDTQQVFLNESELQKVERVLLIKPSQQLVRDLFLFQCYTGLAYTDMISLSNRDITIDPAGRKWIIKKRQKTDIVSTIPLLKPALVILNKYATPNTNQKAICIPPTNCSLLN